MTTLYVAGPMRGIADFNFPAFFEAEKALVAAGYEVINPARRDKDNGFDPTGMTGDEDLSELNFSLREALGWDMAAICSDADGIALLPGWEVSKGAKAEEALASALGLPSRSVGAWVELSVGTAPADFRSLPEGFTERERIQPFVAPSTTSWDAPMIGDPPYGSEWGWHPHFPAHKDTVVTTSSSLRSPKEIVQDALTKVREDFAKEERVRSATGGEKGRKLEELGSIDPLALRRLAEVSGFGARKYAAFNYLKGYDWDLSVNALLRHTLAFWQGEDIDPESGLPHMAHAAWHALGLVSFLERELGTDTRFKQETA